MVDELCRREVFRRSSARTTTGERPKMTREDAAKVLGIMATADGGCWTCVQELLNSFNEEFPGFDDLIQEAWGSERPWKFPVPPEGAK